MTSAFGHARRIAVLAIALGLTACSMGQMVVRGSEPLMAGGLKAMNRETDLKLAEAAIPANLEMLRGMIEEDPHNGRLRIYVAQGLYAYAFGFVELHDRARASALYRRGFDHARVALQLAGLKGDVIRIPLKTLDAKLAQLGRKAVPALFWTATCWAEWIDMNRDSPAAIAQLARAAALMKRVLELQEDYYYAGADLFFGVYYGSRPPMLGGNMKLAAHYFDRARAATGGKLLMVDVLRAQYLDRQQQNRKAFHDRLTAVVNAPQGLLPDMALANQMARARARYLLKQEAAWF
ncbi:MAG: TRAP transporter TatT component family protein [Gammaproteobacteria bacterium]